VIVLVLGGARSGKSATAEHVAAGLAGHRAVTVLATAAVTDPDMAARVAAHRARRPPGWTTTETGADLLPALRATEGTAVVESLGAWLAGMPDMVAPADELCAALLGRDGHTVAVSEEVGLGVHPPTEAGRRFRDALGTLNQAVAAVAHEVVLVVAGRVLRLADAADLGLAGVRRGAG
jgi:adenosyl cobinamide kinase/adenosyl cobinamide phosphate guanylyltransferase